MLKIRNKETGLSLLRSLPFLLTLGLFLSLMLTTIGSEARAEGSQSDTEEDTLPEYSITLSDSQSSSSCSSVAISGNTVTITDAGSYTLSGSLSDGRICVDTDKESRVRLILAGVRITSSDSAAIYVRSADKVVILLEDGTDNTLISSGSFMQTDENNIDAVVFSKDDLTIKGNGTLNVTASDGHGIVSKDDLKIKGGLISVTSARKALSANDSITIDDGNLAVLAVVEERVEARRKGVEYLRPDPLRLETIHEVGVHKSDGAHVIVENTDFHTGFCPLRQDVPDRMPAL